MLTNSYAGFAQGTYSITDSTRATIGLRYTHDTRQLDGVRYAAAGNPLPVGTVLLTSASLSDANRKPSFNKLTWRFALDQQITRDVLVYASASRGFKSGVFNVNTPNLPAVQPETLDAYEAGIKSDLFDHVLRLNVSAYYSNYSNIQLTANLSGSPQLINAAKGRIKGVDAELTFAPRLPVGNLEIRSAVSFLDAKFTSFPGGPNFVPRPAPAGGNVQTFADFAGNYFQSAPRFTSTVSTSYDLPVGPNRVGISATWYHNGGFFWDPQNRVRQDGYDLLSGQLYYAFGGDRFKLRTYVRNLTNKRYFSFVSVSTTGDLGIPAPPRTYGVAFDFNF
jgi:iron complex outermembrane receptor protein